MAVRLVPGSRQVSRDTMTPQSLGTARPPSSLPLFALPSALLQSTIGLFPGEAALTELLRFLEAGITFRQVPPPNACSSLNDSPSLPCPAPHTADSTGATTSAPATWQTCCRPCATAFWHLLQTCLWSGCRALAHKALPWQLRWPSRAPCLLQGSRCPQSLPQTHRVSNLPPPAF